MFSKKVFIFYLILIYAALIFPVWGCKMAPKNIKTVSNFDIKRFTGNWYEIARFDFIHEKNMENVTAFYSVNDDGTIKVLNRGFNTKLNQWQESTGKGKFQKSPSEGALKVSFFGPFYTGYNIIALDSDYKSALVVGKNYNYLWILSRTPKLDDSICKAYLEQANNLGFNISKIIWTNQN